MSPTFWSTDPVGKYHSSACSCGFGTTLRPVKKRDGKVIKCTLEMYYGTLICAYKASTCFRSYDNESVPVETVFNNINLFNLGYFYTYNRQAEVIVNSAVAAAAKLQDEARKVISHPFEDFFQNELKKLHLEKLKFIESLVYEERAV